MEKTPKESSSMRLCSIEVQVKVTKSLTKSVTNFGLSWTKFQQLFASCPALAKSLFGSSPVSGSLVKRSVAANLWRLCLPSSFGVFGLDKLVERNRLERQGWPPHLAAPVLTPTTNRSCILRERVQCIDLWCLTMANSSVTTKE